MKLQKLKPASTAQRSADALREEILRREPGALLGSETELADTIGVSLPTFRQAARLLEHEGLLLIKRGQGGGYYGARPDIETVVQSAAQYVRANNLKREDITEAVSVMIGPLITKAAQCQDVLLREFMERFVSITEFSNDGDFDEDNLSFSTTLGEMTENVFLALFSRLIFNRTIMQDIPKRLGLSNSQKHDVCQFRSRLAKAILSGEAQEAARISNEFHQRTGLAPKIV